LTSRRMHIAFVSPEYIHESAPQGGIANYLRNVGTQLMARGHQISVVHLLPHGGKSLESAFNIRPIQLPATTGKVATSFSEPWIQYLNARRIEAEVWRLHRETPIDLVQATNYYSPAVSLVGNRRIPIVCRLSTHTPLWRSSGGWSASAGNHLSDRMEARQVRRADGVFSPSRFVTGFFERVRSSIEIIRTPVEQMTDEDEEYHHRHLRDRRYLLFFGRLSRAKGVDLLASAIGPLLASFPELSIVILGRDEPWPRGGTTAELLWRACPEPHRQRLIVDHPLPKSLLRPVIRNAAAVLMPSRVDNYPNACLEAQALGVPVIASDRSSLEEMIDDGVDGLLFENGSPEALAFAATRLLRLPKDEEERMRAAVRERSDAREREDRVGQLLLFYERIIEEFASRKAPRGSLGLL
jgi:glycogen synthase